MRIRRLSEKLKQCDEIASILAQAPSCSKPHAATYSR
jgi:hypothetical protein